ncbi:anti-sigma factor [Georgenia wangjunii]|uniref:anti-sigma factor n=1 Tax=Georgenia wangjunii TaxID=3117730 RepID=UPI002F269E0D
MPHSDDDDLALSALEGARDETCTCQHCQDELAAYRRTVAAGRAGVELERPAPSVWDRIAAEIGATPETGSTEAPAVLPVAEAAPPPAPAVEPAAPAVDGRDELTGRRAERERRTNPWARRSAWIAAAAFVVGVGGTLAVQQLTAPGAPEVLASTDLDPLPGWDASGSAVVEQVGDRLELVIDLPTGAVDGYREVWLIDRQVQRLVSVGVLTADEGRFALPDGLDITEFPIVDVSREPIDGDPAHSGDSIVRGDLT